MNSKNDNAAKATLSDQNMAFWRQFYAKHALRHEPSPFARWCLEHYLSAPGRLLELGCGNGRDTFTFLNSGLNVLAVDGCDVAIADNQLYQSELENATQGQFIAHDLGFVEALLEHQSAWFDAPTGLNAVYSRFFLHAIPEVVEDQVLAFCAQQIVPGGLMLHEFRTSKDPLSEKGERLSETERWTDHYRRFIETSAFRHKLAEQGWEEVAFIESKGLALFGDEDPVVARIVVRKPEA